MEIKRMETYCIYLRKSRADAEAEARGEGETLARHEKTLRQLAEKQRLRITKIYREIVSGETIAARPQMQQLLQDIETGMYAGVLVMEIERLARGDTIDQGIVAQAFKYSGTKIVTPTKTYDPDNEFDEEFFEFSLFMSRREYNTIKRRMQAGRAAAAKEGKYVGNIPPYGYDREKLDHDSGFTLVPNPEEAKIVKLVFEWYVHGAVMEDGSKQRIGSTRIANKLQLMGCKTRSGDQWSLNTVRSILTNPVYAGMIRWGYTAQKKVLKNGVVTMSRPIAKDGYIMVKGLHEPLISSEEWETAQELRSQKRTIPKVNCNFKLQNPLAGILICQKCGKHMTRRPYSKKHRKDTIICNTPGCPCVASDLDLVEQRVLDSLETWLNRYALPWNDTHQSAPETSHDADRAILDDLQKEQDKTKNQLSKCYDLLETGVYDTNTFAERSSTLKAKIYDLQQKIESLEEQIKKSESMDDGIRSMIPKVQNILETYHSVTDAAAKNQMLKEVLEKAEYYKKINTRWHGSPDDFELTIFPKLPQQK